MRIQIGATWLRGLTAAALLAVLAACSSTKPARLAAEDPRLAYEKAKEQLARGKCFNAKEQLRLLSLEQAGVSYIDSIVYDLARAYACDGDWELAQAEYQRVVNDYPASALVDDAAFGMAYAQFRLAPGSPGLDQGDAEKAVRSMHDFIDIYPRSDRRNQADSLLQLMENRLARKTFDNGRLYLKLGADSSAMIYFQKLWDDYTESPYAARALWLLAEDARKNEDWATAIQRYRQLILVYPDAIEVERAKVFLQRIEDEQADRLRDQAEDAREGGRLEEALDLYQKILSEYPDYRQASEIQTQIETIRRSLADGSP